MIASNANLAFLGKRVLFSFLILSRRVSSDLDGSGEIKGFKISSIAYNLPAGISDFTATRDPESDLVYIAGGCDSIDGHQFDTTAGKFVCNSLSSQLYVFNHKIEDFGTLAEMPRQRYRHGSVIVNGHLFLIGGRTVDDEIVTEIDVYNIGTNTWHTFEGLSPEYYISDHVGFSEQEDDSHLGYFCGGYNSNNTVVAKCFVLNCGEFVDSDYTNMTVFETGALKIPRADASIITTPTIAILAGGFPDQGCSLVLETEEYNFEPDNPEDAFWTIEAAMANPRANKALVSLQGSIFAIGGESQPIEGTNCTANGLPFGKDEEERTAVDSIERYNPAAGIWELVGSLSDHRYRFEAIAFDDVDKIYSFGGESELSEACNCYPVTNEVLVYEIEYDITVPSEAPTTVTNGDGSTSGGFPLSSVIPSVISFLIALSL